MKQYLLLTGLLLIKLLAATAQNDSKLYTVYKTNTLITIDGALNEPAWQSINYSSRFLNITGDTTQQPKLETRFKMLWDDEHLYIAAKLEEPHIWASLKQRDTVLFHDNVFEIFIDPDNDGRDYYELQVNAFATVFDLMMNKPYKEGGKAVVGWNAKEMEVKVGLDGTLNKGNDIDRKWIIEMKIPFRSLAKTPAVDQVWRMNFCRVQWDMDYQNGLYIKRRNSNHFTTKQYVSWSPQGAIDMHIPAKWGFIYFKDYPSSTKK